MTSEQQAEDLMTLKVIAEILNRTNDVQQTLQHVLEKLLEVTGLKTGWMFLVDEEPHYTFVADHNLPPALSFENKKPMCSGKCFCLSKFWDGELSQAINIINCKRIEDAIRYNWGDTCGITHHATIPISASGELFGILNVASPDKRHFNKDELTLLQSVAYQIGTAIKRTKLYEAQEKRAEYYSKLDDVSRTIWDVFTLEELPEKSLPKLNKTFEWTKIGFFLLEDHGLILRGSLKSGLFQKESKVFPAQLLDRFQSHIKRTSELPESFSYVGFAKNESVITVPLTAGEKRIGLLIISDSTHSRSELIPDEILKSLADHLSLAIENIKLYEKQQELKILEERNRLARDLHDSVNQKLFSLSLTAKGSLSFVESDEKDILTDALMDIQKMSQDALSEMKALIWQLRPVGLEEGLASAIKQYANDLGLTLRLHFSGFIDLPKRHEEIMWRISQEAMNNVRKHADADCVDVHLKKESEGVFLVIEDQGKGFNTEHVLQTTQTFGMTSMRERAEMLGGTLSIRSSKKGTIVSVWIPVKKK